MKKIVLFVVLFLTTTLIALGQSTTITGTPADNLGNVVPGGVVSFVLENCTQSPNILFTKTVILDSNGSFSVVLPRTTSPISYNGVSTTCTATPYYLVTLRTPPISSINLLSGDFIWNKAFQWSSSTGGVSSPMTSLPAGTGVLQITSIPGTFPTSGNVLPNTCNAGNFFTLKSTTPWTPFYCNALNTWVVLSGSLTSYIATGSAGTAQAQTAVTGQSFSTLTVGTIYWWTAAHSNTAANPTLVIDSAVSKIVYKCGGSSLVAGDIKINQPSEVLYDGTAFELLNPYVAGCGFNATVVSASMSAAGGGTAQAQTATYNPAIAALSLGLIIDWNPIATNTGAGPTLAVNGLTPVVITKCSGQALVANDLGTTGAVAFYNGTSFDLLNPQAIQCGIASSATTAGSATNATNSVNAGTTTKADNVEYNLVVAPANSTANQALDVTAAHYNPSTDTLTVAHISGKSGSTGTADTSTAVATTTKSDNVEYNLALVPANSTGNQAIKVGAAHYNASTDTITITSLVVGSGTPLAGAAINVTQTNIGSTTQINVRNPSADAGASSDLTATADNGDQTHNFTNCGINSSTYSVPAYNSGGPDDGYCLTTGNFFVGAIGSAKVVTIGAGGSGLANVVATFAPTKITFAQPINVSSIVGAAEYSLGTCTTAKTITVVNGNNQVVNVTAGNTCVLTFTQPASGSANIRLRIVQDGTTGTGLISGGLWPGGVPTITQTTGAVDIANCYLNGASTYCKMEQAYQ